MNSKVLLASLKAQDANLGLLISNLESQKNAIIHNDYKLLEKGIGEEQQILNRIGIEEKNRIQIINDIANQNSIALNGNSLEQLFRNPNINFGGNLKELEKIRRALKIKVNAVVNLNTQLKAIVEYSRNFFKEILFTVAGTKKNLLVNKKV